MEYTTSYPRNKAYGDRNFQNYGNRRNNNYDDKYYGSNSTTPQGKNTYRQYYCKPLRLNENNDYGYQVNEKRDHQFDAKEVHWKKQNNIRKGYNSPYSTMASEADLETEIAGFKIVQSGKTIIDSQSSDSDSLFSPTETASAIIDKERLKFASATKFLGPCPQAISLPNFL